MIFRIFVRKMDGTKLVRMTPRNSLSPVHQATPCFLRSAVLEPIKHGNPENCDYHVHCLFNMYDTSIFPIIQASYSDTPPRWENTIVSPSSNPNVIQCPLVCVLAQLAIHCNHAKTSGVNQLNPTYPSAAFAFTIIYL